MYRFLGDIVRKTATNRRNPVGGDTVPSGNGAQSASGGAAARPGRTLWALTHSNDSAIDHVTCHDMTSRNLCHCARARTSEMT